MQDPVLVFAFLSQEPPTMVAGARRTRCEAGVDQDDIRTEELETDEAYTLTK
jgi:hypothetical protein